MTKVRKTLPNSRRITVRPHRLPDPPPLGPLTEKTEALAETEQQLREYFAGIRKSFDVLLKPDGTAFFQSVWKALLDIPYGETRTYGDIAKANIS